MTSEHDPPGPTNLIHCNGTNGLGSERESVRELLRAGTFFWLDIHDPKAADLEILRVEFDFHPLALEDSWRFDPVSYTHLTLPTILRV